MKSAFIVLGLMAVLALPGCKIIKNAPEGEGTAVIPEGEEGDDARIGRFWKGPTRPSFCR